VRERFLVKEAELLLDYPQIKMAGDLRQPLSLHFQASPPSLWQGRRKGTRGEIGLVRFCQGAILLFIEI